MYVFGDPDRAPIRISHHSHAYLHTAGEAATAALTALLYREMTGEAQHVDVSVHESVARLDMTQKWDNTKVNIRRGEWLGPINFENRFIWPCKDGYVMWFYWVGPAAELYTQPFIKLMASEGMSDDYIMGIDWEAMDPDTEEGVKEVEEILARAEEPTLRYFMAHTKAELAEKAKKHNVMLYPLSDTKDLLDSMQLAYRDFWQKVEHPELNTSFKYPGAFAITSEGEAMPKISRRAPLIGEHNEEIYVKELGISKKRFSKLKEAGII
jgi:crotonobetainyl-CoA:carnitine CoA-transferase CaiB-like acyl-CoA transferase